MIQPHKHVGDLNKPGQTINPVIPTAFHNEKPLEKLIEEFKEFTKEIELPK